MLIRSIKIELTSSLPAETVREHVRHCAAEWRESALSSSARAEGFVGWRLREHADRFTLRASRGGGNAFVPHFVGTVVPTASGSTLVGELRLSWFPRLFALVWLGALAVGPFIALFGPPADASFDEHVINALFSVLPCGVLFMAGGSWFSYSSDGPALAFRQLLNDVTTSAPATQTSLIGESK